MTGFMALVAPALAFAHSELESSTPADKATVESPFTGPIVLTFSEDLASGSKADLLGPGGAGVASATVDGPGKTMTIALTTALDPGNYEVRWVSVADDGDLLRGTVTFTVAPAPATPEPTPIPTATTTVTSSVTETSRPATPAPTPVASSPSPPPGSFLGENGSDAGSGDVILPIVVALLVVGAGAIFLLGRRNRPTIRR